MNYPLLVNVAWRATEQLVVEWQAKPYKWEREADLQAELVGRLRQVFGILGDQEILGNYGDALPGYEKRQWWSRVAAEPHVPLKVHGQMRRCHPDVVIWDDIPESNSPPEEWPILWACEIKYGFHTPSSGDMDKLQMLIEQEKARFGCWLDVRFARPKGHESLTWHRSDLDARLWRCVAYIPQTQ